MMHGGLRCYLSRLRLGHGHVLDLEDLRASGLADDRGFHRCHVTRRRRSAGNRSGDSCDARSREQTLQPEPGKQLPRLRRTCGSHESRGEGMW